MLELVQLRRAIMAGLGLFLLGLLLARPEEGLEVTSAGTVGAVHVDVASE